MNDLISRQAAIDAIEESRRSNPHLNATAAFCHEHEHRHFIKILSELPSAQPERKKGRWIEPTHEGCFTHDAKAYSQCSECGKKEFLGWRKNFCPNCGADMRGDKDE